MTALTRLLAGLMIFIGLAIVARTVGEGGGPAALGILVGILFVVAGAGRLYLVSVRAREEERER